MPRVLEMWSDLHCPYAYLAAYRLRRAMRERPEAEVRHMSLAIEHADEKVTPKRLLDAEAPLIFLEEPDIPYRPWSAPASAWPVTMWPAFEAVKCAERQGWRQAHDLDWELRRAFWHDSLCISMRHVILRVAKRVDDLDLRRFEKDWDSGVAKEDVLSEARRGWDELKLELSPTFVLPDGSRRENPAGPKVELDEEHGHKLVAFRGPAEDPREAFRGLIRAA